MIPEQSLEEMFPQLEPDSLVYIVKDYEIGEKKHIVVFDHYSDSPDPEDKGNIHARDCMALSPRIVFNGREVPGLSVEHKTILPATAKAFYVGKEDIVRQLRAERLNAYADIVDKL